MSDRHESSRREFLYRASITALGVALSSSLTSCSSGPPFRTEESTDPAKALQALMDGNRRFIEAKLMPHDWNLERRNAVVTGEQPFASVLCCSDPRVPPEVVFDQGLNDLFIVRGAGHTVTDQVLGSLEYSITGLKPPVRLIVVLGHQDCGAIKAAIKEVFNNVTPPGNIASLTKAIRPAVELVRELPEDRRLPEAAKNNVLLVVRQLREDKYLGPLLKDKKVHVVGGIYQMETPIESGRVEFFTATP